MIRDNGKVSLSAPLQANIKGLAELGLIGLSFPKGHGGSGLPFTVTAFVIEMMARACASTMIQNGIAYTAPAAMIFPGRYGGLPKNWIGPAVRQFQYW